VSHVAASALRWEDRQRAVNRAQTRYVGCADYLGRWRQKGEHMSLSSNTLIHFTSDKAALKGILEDNFKLKYCREVVAWTSSSRSIVYVPMVSFCDIPLSEIKDHISKYGHYGIGLTHEWAVKNKFNPVLYVQPSSHLADSYKDLIGDIAKDLEHYEDKKETLKRIIDIARYIKSYEGTLERKGKTFRKYRFSDEREWRYVPPYSEKCTAMYTEKDFNAPGAAQEAADNIANLRLKFSPNDVKYIIIKNDREIGEFIEHLRRAKGKRYSQHQVERLTTRLFTSDQIHRDI
jgi:hypothetical protein